MFMLFMVSMMLMVMVTMMAVMGMNAVMVAVPVAAMLVVVMFIEALRMGMMVMVRVIVPEACQMSFDSFFIKFRRFSFFKRDGVLGAGWETVAKPVTIIVPDQCGFAIHQFYSSFVTGINT